MLEMFEVTTLISQRSQYTPPQLNNFVIRSTKDFSTPRRHPASLRRTRSEGAARPANGAAMPMAQITKLRSSSGDNATLSPMQAPTAYTEPNNFQFPSTHPFLANIIRLAPLVQIDLKWLTHDLILARFCLISSELILRDIGNTHNLSSATASLSAAPLSLDMVPSLDILNYVFASLHHLLGVDSLGYSQRAHCFSIRLYWTRTRQVSRTNRQVDNIASRFPHRRGS
jgi:hypothetical protein